MYNTLLILGHRRKRTVLPSITCSATQKSLISVQTPCLLFNDAVNTRSLNGVQETSESTVSFVAYLNELHCTNSFGANTEHRTPPMWLQYLCWPHYCLVTMSHTPMPFRCNWQKS